MSSGGLPKGVKNALDPLGLFFKDAPEAAKPDESLLAESAKREQAAKDAALASGNELAAARRAQRLRLAGRFSLVGPGGEDGTLG